MLTSLLLGSCSLPQQVWYQVEIKPSLGYEVDDQGKIIIASSQAIVHVAPGAPEATLTQYSFEVLNDSGNPVPGLEQQGSLGVIVPPGRSETTNSFERRSSDPFDFSLDGTIAREHLSQGAPANWRLRVTWTFVTDSPLVGTLPSTQEYKITFPRK